MGRLLSTTLLFLMAGQASAQEHDAVVRLREVEVRSGPSAKYYATGKLRYGDKVHVTGYHEDYVAITPPADEFSVIAKSAIRLIQGKEGIVEADSADTYQGSTVVGEVNARGTRLVRGSVVTVLEEVTLPTRSGSAPFYKIVPLNESRYIPLDAIREPTVVTAGGTAPPSSKSVQQASATANDQIGRLLNMADIAYKKGEVNGDWTEAKRLYEELAKCDNFEARNVALNRLSFIRKKNPGLFAAGGSASGTTAGTSSYRPPPAEPMPPPSPLSRLAPIIPPLAPARGPEVGWLRRAVTAQAGQPGYYVADVQGHVLFHVAPGTGVDLLPYVDQRVEISGGPMVYRADLRGNYMIALSARRVQ